jgi:hypothetical protein
VSEAYVAFRDIRIDHASNTKKLLCRSWFGRVKIITSGYASIDLLCFSVENTPGGSWPGNAVSMGQEFHIIAVCAYSLMVWKSMHPSGTFCTYPYIVYASFLELNQKLAGPLVNDALTT